MFDILKTIRETAVTKADAVPSRRSAKLRPELIRLQSEAGRTQCAIDAARNRFEQVVDPALIDCYTYELDAAQLRYQFLLRKFKSQGN